MGCSFSKFKAVTVSCMLLLPNSGHCEEHTDMLNDLLCAHSKPRTLNRVMVDLNNNLHMLQVMCNF